MSADRSRVYKRRRHDTLISLPLQAVVAQPRSYAPVTNTKDNPPCNTLFIGNLSEHTSEDELRGIFQGQPGRATPPPSNGTAAAAVLSIPPAETDPGCAAKRAWFSA